MLADSCIQNAIIASADGSATSETLLVIFCMNPLGVDSDKENSIEQCNFFNTKHCSLEILQPMSNYIDSLKKIVPSENLVTDKVDRVAYARDLTPYFAVSDVIVFPTTREEVIRIVKLAADENIPITPRGGGASFQGSSLPVDGGIIIDLSRMDRILEISNEDMIAVVEPGVRYETFDHELEKQGLAFPHDVGSHDAASMGGILASDSNGHHAYKYGRVSSWIQAMEVVLADGSVMELGGRPPRSNMGFNLMSLIAGSEGTLGIITKATIRLIPRPPVEASVGAFFDDLDDLMEASFEINMSGVDAGTLEATDGYTVSTIDDVLDFGFPECEGNFVGDLQGYSEEDLQRRIDVVTAILENHGGKQVTVARDDTGVRRLWAPRMEVDVAIMETNPGYREFGFAAADPCVPLSKQADAMRKIGNIIRSHGLIAAVFCHTGIGIIHPAVLIDPKSSDHWAGMKKAEREIIDYVQSIGGILTAEHGLGYVRNPYVRNALGDKALHFDRKIKQLFDPQGILNPGKMGLDREERDEGVQFTYPAYVEDKELWE